MLFRSSFNNGCDDNAYVGYMYGKVGALTYAETHANINDSTIKKFVDDWYKTNILGTANEQYLADNIFCNDRSLLSENSGNGVGISDTYYRCSDFLDNSDNLNVVLTCPQQNDAFTVSDITNGNGALTYPVGLLSTDEIVLAGGWYEENSGYYLYSGKWWWSSSPILFQNNLVRVGSVYSTGNGYDFDFALENHYVNEWQGGVRPVFNLKADVLAEGSGIASDPYRLSLTS